MAKINRERAVREKRLIKKAKKEARKLAAAEPPVEEPTDVLDDADEAPPESDAH